MLTREKAYHQYEESLASIDKQAKEARENARGILQGQLRVLREAHHTELKVLRGIAQKTRGK